MKLTLNNFIISATTPTVSIVNSNAPSVVSFGSLGSYTYNPWGTLPYLQLPGWTAAAVYTIIAGLFVLYVVVLFGQAIPPINRAYNTVTGMNNKLLEITVRNNCQNNYKNPQVEIIGRKLILN